MFITCPEEESMLCLKLMQWQCYELVVHGKTQVGENCKMLRLQYKETTTKCFLDYLKPKLSNFIIRNYVACFQRNNTRFAFKHFQKHLSCLLWILQKTTRSTSTTKYKRNALALISIENINSYLLQVKPLHQNVSQFTLGFIRF